MHLVIPAAGRSHRAGHPKGLLPIADEPLMTRQLRRDPACFAAVFVVVGPGESPYASLLTELVSVPVYVTINGSPERGPFSSIQAGLAAALFRADAPVALLPLDVPVFEPFAWDRLSAALTGPVEAVIAGFRGAPGHPVLLAPGLARRLLRLDPAAPEARLDVQLQRAGAVIVETDDARVTLNLNTPADWAALRGKRAP